MNFDPRIPDLFDPMRYPVEPGYRPIDTSYEAAKKVRPKKEYYEQCVIDALTDHGPMTDEQIALVANEDFASIQPARSRLKAREVIEDSGERGRTKRGNSCAVWKLKPQEDS